jgi:hypothetical protein
MTGPYGDFRITAKPEITILLTPSRAVVQAVIDEYAVAREPRDAFAKRRFDIPSNHQDRLV